MFDTNTEIDRTPLTKKLRVSTTIVLWILSVAVIWQLAVFRTLAQPSEAKPKASDRLIGTWDFTLPSDPTLVMSLEFSKNKRMTLSVKDRGKTTKTEPATWEIVSEKLERVTIRPKWDSKARPYEWDIEILSDESIRVNFVVGKVPPVTYKRRR